VQRDFEHVKAELVKVMDRYNAQHRKYADHKLAVKNKLHNLRSVVSVLVVAQVKLTMI